MLFQLYPIFIERYPYNHFRFVASARLFGYKEYLENTFGYRTALFKNPHFNLKS